VNYAMLLHRYGSLRYSRRACFGGGCRRCPRLADAAAVIATALARRQTEGTRLFFELSRARLSSKRYLAVGFAAGLDPTTDLAHS